MQTDDAASPPDLSGLRILLVEDNALNREVALGLLAPTNCEVVTAEDGLQAVSIVKNQHIESWSGFLDH